MPNRTFAFANTDSQLKFQTSKTPILVWHRNSWCWQMESMQSAVFFIRYQIKGGGEGWGIVNLISGVLLLKL